METVSNIVTAAQDTVTKAIWGDASAEEKQAAETAALGGTPAGNETAGQEPKNGELGDVKAGEPYDKGNVEPDAVSETTNSTGTGTFLTYRPSAAANTVMEDKETTTAPAIIGEKPTPGLDKEPELATGSAAEGAHAPLDKNTVPGAAVVDPAAATTTNPSTSQKTMNPPVGSTTAPETTDSKPSTDPASADYKAPKLTDRSPQSHESGPAAPSAADKDDPESKTKVEKPSSGGGIKLGSGNDQGGAGEKAVEKMKMEKDRLKEKIPGGHDDVESGNGSEVGEGKEKLSLKDKIKAKLHRNKD